MQFLPNVIRAEIRAGYVIHLTFNDGCKARSVFHSGSKVPCSSR